MDGVVGDGDGMAEGSPFGCGGGAVRSFWQLRNFPHSGHERRVLRTFDQTYLPVSAIEGAPDFALDLRDGAGWFELGQA